MAAPLMIAFNKGQLRKCSSPQPHYGLSALQQHLQICLRRGDGGDAEVLDQILQHIRREERRERRTEKVTQISQRTTRVKLLSYFSAEAQRLRI